jgi:glyoxylase-like metal-dependent hydrolase (beta-lactamase superfamily II)
MHRARLVLSALLLAIALVPAALAKEPRNAKGVLKLYVLDCGVLLYNSLLRFGYKDGQVTPTTLSDACYLIDDPGKGAMIWDTGVVPDSLWQEDGVPPKKLYGEATKPLVKQLAEIGYAPKDITYVAVSHAHWDHLANLSEFSASTWLTAPYTHDLLLSATPPRQTEPAMFAALKTTRTILLPDDRDYDVFGDGKVTVIPAPGHTPDSKVLMVKLKTFGPIFLVGDLYHFEKDIETNKIASNEDGAQLTASRAKIQALAAKTHGHVWIPHDFKDFAALKKAPLFYD